MMEPAKTSVQRIYLTNGWTFKQKDDDAKEAWMPVESVPSSVHTDLLANKKILDPFVDLNELAVRWVAEKDWVYRLLFKTPPSSDKSFKGLTGLFFEGLDTFATVCVNGYQVLKTSNMFLAHMVPIHEFLKRKGNRINTLEITFTSALRRGRELVEKHKDEHDFLVRQTENSRLPVRKAQYHWGWDWSPILTTAGIWRPVHLLHYELPYIHTWEQAGHVRVDYIVSPDLKKCTGWIRLKGGPGSTSIMISMQSSMHSQEVLRVSLKLARGGLAAIPFEIDNPKLWYPHEYGDRNLYELRVEFSHLGKILDTATKTVGFRRCELVRDIDEFGTSFYFRVNNIDIFAGGACWIPADNFLSNISKERYRDWVQLIVEGNQTMVRVWGGSIYEDDAFFEACDELGLMVWQDFQFACGNYPTYPEFINSVELEARQNVQRLSSHPSLVIWAGNNEDYETVQERYNLDYDPDDMDPQSWLKSNFPARYIYEYLLPKVIAEDSSSVIYLPSSPWSGNGKTVKDPTVGDIHQWNLWHGAMNRYQDAPILSGRFISEFGMQGYPHIQTMQRMITSPGQQNPGSMTMDFHNKAIGHNQRLMTYMSENFQMPRNNNLRSFIHLSQVMQAEAMRSTYKAWRREWGQQGKRKCGGVLVWQLNDCCPTVSWAVVDYYLVKKPAYYAIKRALRSLDISVSRTCRDWNSTYINPSLSVGHVDPTLGARGTDEYDVWVSSSRGIAVIAEVKVRFISIRSGEDIALAVTTTSTIIANGTREIMLNQLLPPCIPHPEDPSLPFDVEGQYDPYVVHATLFVDGNIVSDDTAWPQPIKYLDFAHRDIVISPMHNGVLISAKRPVKGFVIEEREGMRSLSNNGFDIMPGQPRVVQGISMDEMQDRWRYVGMN